MPIRVFVIDSQQIVCAGIRHTCNQHDDLVWVGEARNLDEARLAMPSVAPDLMIVDPDALDAIATMIDSLASLRDEFPESKILAFTTKDCSEDAAAVMSAGAAGYLIKDAGLEEMALAIRCIHVGRTFISHTNHGSQPRVAKSKAIGKSPSGDGHDLSQREREVLDMIASGMTNKQAAAELFLSVKTVETYRSRIMRKAGLRDRRELVMFAASLDASTKTADDDIRESLTSCRAS